jgi:hypothetical protein
MFGISVVLVILMTFAVAELLWPQKVKEGFSYNSLDNEQMENVESLRELIREHIDPNFKA